MTAGRGTEMLSIHDALYEVAHREHVRTDYLFLLLSDAST
jgi:hypothetical protein